MPDWIDSLAGALGEEPLNPKETTRLLKSSREVAHRVERRFTPLATFLVGATVARETASGKSREDAIAGALAALEDLLPEAAEDER